MASLLVRVALLVMPFASLAACNKAPTVGDSCKSTDILCVDPKTELACQKGVFIVSPCKGPMGCKEDGKHLVCDATGDADGDPCSTDEEGAAQCIGDGARITCRGGKYARDFCRGEAGCDAKSGAIRCDQSKSQEGDPCSGETSACSLDGKNVLSCHSGKFTMVAACPGEDGCTIVERRVNCDLGKKDDSKRTLQK
jgi:hypothetical protein